MCFCLHLCPYIYVCTLLLLLPGGLFKTILIGHCSSLSPCEPASAQSSHRVSVIPPAVSYAVDALVVSHSSRKVSEYVFPCTDPENNIAFTEGYLCVYDKMEQINKSPCMLGSPIFSMFNSLTVCSMYIHIHMYVGEGMEWSWCQLPKPPHKPFV